MSDVCLLLEGTYPYVAGGVSSWVHTLIKKLHDVSFSIVYLGAHRSKDRKLHYDIPSNVVDFREVYLFDYRVEQEKNIHAKKADWNELLEFIKRMRKSDTSYFGKLVDLVGDAGTRRISLYDLAYSYEGWKVLQAMYREESEEYSFIDYFWTWRFLYFPFFSLLRMRLPEAKVYHSVSTGYAGVLGALAKMRSERPFLLTEHGIYTRERKIEISRADWIFSETESEQKVLEGGDFFKDWWTNLFTFCSLLTYEYADEIITLYELNRKIQIEEGAPPAKTQIIPNGVAIRCEAYEKPIVPPVDRYRIGFVGRVVPIKDVKTFIMACPRICQELKNVEIYILGPTDEDEDYFKECELLVRMEGLEDNIHFAGKVNMQAHYPNLDMIVLTSISEAQPLVILEAGVYGIPIVATDVGSCPELLLGGRADDKLLGPSGIVTPVCDSAATAEACVKILKDPELYRRMALAARKRISTYYREDDFLARYEELYARYSEVLRWQE